MSPASKHLKRTSLSPVSDIACPVVLKASTTTSRPKLVQKLSASVNAAARADVAFPGPNKTCELTIYVSGPSLSTPPDDAQAARVAIANKVKNNFIKAPLNPLLIGMSLKNAADSRPASAALDLDDSNDLGGHFYKFFFFANAMNRAFPPSSISISGFALQ